MHVTHTTRPFNTRIRVAPEVASRPERIQRDLVQIKKLASVLEEDAAFLRRFKPNEVQRVTGSQQQMETERKDESLTSPTEGAIVSSDQEIENESDPPEPPSEAIERRVEYLTAESQNRDPEDGIGWDAKKVHFF